MTSIFPAGVPQPTRSITALSPLVARAAVFPVRNRRAPAFMALAALFVILLITGCSEVAVRPVRLVVTGSEGERFTGTYVADGVTNSVDSVVPATIDLQAKDLTYEFKRQGGEGEFRVELYVGDTVRTSTTSDKQRGVRGWLRYSADKESYGASSF